MRLHLLLPKVDPKTMAVVTKCRYVDCSRKPGTVAPTGEESAARHGASSGRGASLSLPQMQTHLSSVSSGSDACGIRSDRVKGLAVMLYLLGLSYGAVSLTLEKMARPTLQDAGLPNRPNGSRTHSGLAPRPDASARGC